MLQSQKQEEEARLAQARAALQLARNDLDNTVIRAPVAGIVGNRAGRVGQYVKPGTQLLSLVPLPYVYVTANFKETQLTHMRPGQSAGISVDAYPDQPLTGRIESFAPASGAEFSLLPPDNATGNFTKIVQRVPVRIALPADGPLARLLRPGLSVTVTVDTRTGPSAAAGVGIVGGSVCPTDGRARHRGQGMTLVPSLRRAGFARARVAAGLPTSAAPARPPAPPTPAPGAGAPAREPSLRDWFGVLAMVGRPVHGDHGRSDRHQLA